MTELPRGWSWVTLEEAMSECKNGLTYRNTPELAGFPVSRIETISKGEIDFQKVGYGGVELKGNEKHLLKPGDILFSHINSMLHVGKVAIYKNGMPELLHGMNLLRITPSDDFVPEFLFYLLQSNDVRRQIWSKAKHAVNQASINIGELKTVVIPKPPIKEQNKIVQDLEDHLLHLDSAMVDVMQAKLKAAQFRNVYVDDFLTKSDGAICSLGSILNFTSGFAYKSSIWQDKGIPVVKIMNVKHREVDLDGCSFISAEIAESSKNFAVKKGDLLFNMTGATLGAFGFYNLELEARMNQRVGKFVPLNLNELNLNYLAYFLEAASTQQRIQQLAKGAAQPNISPTDILSLEICLPKFGVQNAIVDELDARLSKVTQVDQLCSITKVESNALRRSLLQAAFTGQLSKENVSV
jgi:type I restriction enzyme S subunit